MTAGHASHAPATSPAEVRRFYSAVPLGLANAIVARDLAQRLNLDPHHADRLLRALAESAVITHGLLVCTGNPGYWRPLSREEAGQSIGWKASQAGRMFQRVKAEQTLLDAAFPADGQPAAEPSAQYFYNLVGESMPLFVEESQP